MIEWFDFLNEVNKHIEKLRNNGCDMPYFRGHSNSTWSLLCGLGRIKKARKALETLETIIYYDFMSQAGPLLGKNADSWDILFTMQHHGLPTRLLDWSTAFGPALYFAIKPFIKLSPFDQIRDLSSTPCVWILDPFELNKRGRKAGEIGNPHTDFDGTYQENFIEKTKNIEGEVVVINPTRHAPRQSAQRSAFTLHNDLKKPVNSVKPHTLKKFIIPTGSLPHAIQFLDLAGINEYSIFPDLDGLARHLNTVHINSKMTPCKHCGSIS